jgi:hypothetical protein
MKSLALVGLLIAGTAQAETVNLVPQACTATNICFQVQNDAGLSIDYISDAIQYRRLIVSVNGDQYDSGLYALNGSMNQTNVPLYDPDGKVLYATLAFTVTIGTCVRSGRATVCPRHVHLDSGTLVI